MIRLLNAQRLTLLLLATSLVVLPTIQAALTPSEQARVNIRLIRLWLDSDGVYNQQQAAQVTVAELRTRLNSGAEINAKDSFGDTSLILAASSDNLACLKYLLDRGADINATDQDGSTALMEATSSGNKDCVKVLAAEGADINAKDNSGMTALMDAAEAGDAGVVRLLISRGANVSAETITGDTARSLARGDGPVLAALAGREAYSTKAVLLR